MLSGLYGTYLISKKSKWAFVAWIVTGICGISVAAISMQFGILTYNLIAIALYAKSLHSWSDVENVEMVAVE